LSDDEGKNEMFMEYVCIRLNNNHIFCFYLFHLVEIGDGYFKQAENNKRMEEADKNYGNNK
jgi:hypothetical protein